MSGKAVSVLTLNVWNREGDWPARKPLIQAVLARCAPDLIALCEVKDRDHADDILGGRYDFHWAGNDISGVVIAARWPLSSPETLWLEGEGDRPGGLALRGIVASPFGPISLTCATGFFFQNHMAPARERQTPALSDFARGSAERGGFPPVLAGDFNTDPDSAEIRFLKGLQSLNGRGTYFCDAWEHGGDGGKGATWSNRNPHAARVHWPDRRIDYIFVGHPRADGAGKIINCEVVADMPEGGVWPSDHFGVLADLSTGE